MIINHNIASLNTYRQLSANGANTQKSLEKLSSGLRINKAGDDAAGLAISEKMRGQIRGLEQASRNAQDGISMIQTAEGGLNETHSILQRMRELSVQASNGTLQDSDRQAISSEVTELKNEINRIANTTQFNGKNLLDGTLGATASTDATKTTALGIVGVTSVINQGLVSGVAGADKTYSIAVNGANYELKDGATVIGTALTTDVQALDGVGGGIAFKDTNGKSLLNVQVSSAFDSGTVDLAGNVVVGGNSVKFLIGANAGQDLSLSIANSDTTGLGINSIDVTNASSAQSAITTIDSAINTVSSSRSSLGASQNRLEHTINNLGTSSENLTAAESRIRDVDMAKEMMDFTKNNILSQAAQAMLAQANQQPQGVLQLLR